MGKNERITPKPLPGSPADRAHEYHPLGCALAKADAARLLLLALAGGYVQMPEFMTSSESSDAQDWMRSFAENALADAIKEARTEFRKALTPEQAHEQMIHGPKAVA